jgi:hypothetical protein
MSRLDAASEWLRFPGQSWPEIVSAEDTCPSLFLRSFLTLALLQADSAPVLDCPCVSWLCRVPTSSLLRRGTLSVAPKELRRNTPHRSVTLIVASSLCFLDGPDGLGPDGDCESRLFFFLRDSRAWHGKCESSAKVRGIKINIATTGGTTAGWNVAMEKTGGRGLRVEREGDGRRLAGESQPRLGVRENESRNRTP